MTTTSGRPLRFYEQINSKSNVNFMLDFECDKPVSKETVTKAFELVRKRHPYFQMRIDASSATFVHEPNQALDLAVEHYDMTTSSVNDDWQSRLVRIGSNLAYSDSLARFELYSFGNGRYQLYGCINHAGK